MQKKLEGVEVKINLLEERSQRSSSRCSAVDVVRKEGRDAVQSSYASGPTRASLVSTLMKSCRNWRLRLQMIR